MFVYNQIVYIKERNNLLCVVVASGITLRLLSFTFGSRWVAFSVLFLTAWLSVTTATICNTVGGLQLWARSVIGGTWAAGESCNKPWHYNSESGQQQYSEAAAFNRWMKWPYCASQTSPQLYNQLQPQTVTTQRLVPSDMVYTHSPQFLNGYLRGWRLAAGLDMSGPYPVTSVTRGLNPQD